ncbi:6532_t:CDS:10 [Funneliformis geosporum]|uniref:6532_t:CDS:1 n=1 Tax=Funneliformis geosporum TaxID=1117311 RepID=A0A9W4WPT1_9GLOM|nr:6532_t:CDS:10 [Funneliformis geosporum]
MGNFNSNNGLRFPVFKVRKGSKNNNDLVPNEIDFNEEANFTWLRDRRVLDETIYLLERYSEESNNIALLLHQIYKYILRGNTRTPMTPGMQNCLHLGMGHFIWLVEMANEHQGVQFEGFDISINPNELTELPPNVNLRSGDLLRRLPYPNASFDYVNVRCLLTVLPSEQIPFALSEIIRVSRTNARIEFLEMDIFIKNTGPYYENCLGKIWRQIWLLDVNCSKLSIPIGKYGERVGDMYAKHFIYSSTAIAAHLEMSHDKMQDYLLKCVEEFNQNHSFTNIYLLCARKG